MIHVSYEEEEIHVSYEMIINAMDPCPTFCIPAKLNVSIHTHAHTHTHTHAHAHAHAHTHTHTHTHTHIHTHTHPPNHPPTHPPTHGYRTWMPAKLRARRAATNPSFTVHSTSGSSRLMPSSCSYTHTHTHTHTYIHTYK